MSYQPTSERTLAEQRNGRGQSLGELVRELREEATTLIRQEFSLAKVETTETAQRLSGHGVKMAIGGVLALLGLWFLLLSTSNGTALLLIAAGMEVHATWLAPLIVGILVCLIGYGMYSSGQSSFKRERMNLENTQQSLKEDKAWMEQRVTTARS